ncbi:MAG: hypothetical protein HY544_04875 [Candidatus Diapherotrites archaeon]|uniref:Uncharacterized protein n=1 Tax=Candidatus Iainarchaeum sp. TaxID=3101447 RepID=A0A8T3YLZ9_9ARCH|nr:hypothetical protein [Candidatus Diapherotrites archaeon]
MGESYTGPVFYVVHGPLFTHEKPETNALNEAVYIANMKKIRGALEKAGLMKIPVVYETGHFDRDKERLQKFVSGIKNKPRIIWVERPEGIRAALKENMVNPKRFVVAGHFRDICVHSGIIEIRNDFPDAEIYLLEGAFTAYFAPPGNRRYYRDELREIGVKFSKKLARKHFV